MTTRNTAVDDFINSIFFVLLSLIILICIIIICIKMIIKCLCIKNNDL